MGHPRVSVGRAVVIPPGEVEHGAGADRPGAGPSPSLLHL